MSVFRPARSVMHPGSHLRRVQPADAGRHHRLYEKATRDHPPHRLRLPALVVHRSPGNSVNTSVYVRNSRAARSGSCPRPKWLPPSPITRSRRPGRGPPFPPTALTASRRHAGAQRQRQVSSEHRRLPLLNAAEDTLCASVSPPPRRSFSPATPPPKSSACCVVRFPSPTPTCCSRRAMNALYAAFRAISAVQARAGHTAWLQLGWLYLDSIALLKNSRPTRRATTCATATSPTWPAWKTACHPAPASPVWS